jgi:iron(III) transport system permease protein
MTVATGALSGARRLPTGAPFAAAGRLAYTVLVFGPLVALGLTVLPAWATMSAGAAPVLSAERTDLLVRSAGLALGVAVGAMGVGLLAATVLWRWRSGPLAHARWLVLALAPVPPYVHALAWSSTAHGVSGWLTGRGIPTATFTGTWAAAWVQAMALLPLAVALALVAIDNVPDDLVEAGRVTVPDGAVFGRIVLPLARPMLVAGLGVLFVLSVVDYSVPTLFQVNVYSLAIFAAFSASNDPASAVVVALPLVGLAVLAVMASQAGIRQAAQRAVRARPASGVPWRWPGPMRAVQVFACAVLAGQILVPLCALSAAVGSPEVLVATVVAARSEVALSLAVAVGAAVLCLPPALAVADRLAAGGRVSRVWWLGVTLPLALPAPLVGIGLVAAWNHATLPVYGTALMPVLASAARFAPLAAIVLLAQLRRIDPGLVDAARVHQVSAWHGWLRVRLALLAPGLVAAACVTFALALGELGATLIVVPPGQQTLTLRIYNYLHYGGSDTVAGLCLAMVGTAIAAGTVAVATLATWSRLLSGPPEGGPGGAA